MRTTTPRRLALPLGLLVGLLAPLAGCDTTADDSLYGPNQGAARPDPVIAAVTPMAPPAIVLAGIDQVTITGENFAPEPSENLVYFGDVRAEVLAASPTELVVQAPNVPAAAIPLRLAVLGAENFSNAVTYRLDPAIITFGDVARIEEVFGVVSDEAGALYASLLSSGSSIGVKRFSPEGDRSDYFTSTFVWPSLALGADGALYGVRRVRAVFRLPEGGAQETFSVLPNGIALAAIAAAPDGALWTGGSATSAEVAGLYRIAPDGTAERFAFEPNVRDLVVFDGALYVATRNQVWRFPLGAGGALETGAVHYDASADLGAEEINAIALAADGTLFVGTTAVADPVLEVTPGGESSVLYPGIISQPVTALAWGPGSLLYAVQSRVAASGSAPERQARIVRIETRREGGH